MKAAAGFHALAATRAFISDPTYPYSNADLGDHLVGQQYELHAWHRRSCIVHA